MFHTQPAKWIEIVVAQADLPTTLEALAGLHAVELQAQAKESYTPADLSGLRSGIEDYAELARRYRTYWPDADYSTPMPSITPIITLNDALARAHGWVIKARPHITILQEAIRHEADFKHLDELLDAVGDQFPMRYLSKDEGALFESDLFLLDADHPAPVIPADILSVTYTTKQGSYLAATGPKELMERLDAEMAIVKARRIFIPHIPAEHANEIHDLLKNRISGLRAQQSRARAKIADLSFAFNIAQLRANIERLRWLTDHIGFTSNTQLFTRITGWCGCGPAVIRQALDLVEVDFALSMSEPPAGVEPPQLFDNARWSRPFEAFVRLLGMPSKTEADPTPMVALIAPLLFGFMFGDVGQGAVLLLAGLGLRRRFPAAAILVPGGLFAILFGFAFGSIFTREDVIAPLWLHPLSHPITVLGAALAIGVVVLLAGLILNNRQAHWRGRDRLWWGRDAGLVLAYGGLLLSFLNTNALMLTGLGIVWYAWGSTLLATEPAERLKALGVGLGELVETLFQLSINTLSFVRVGAFAIAHAGLSSAIDILATIPESQVGYWVVIIAGNIFIIAMEGLVAGIQTTRLILFEFFIRFLRAEGRALHALPTPAQWTSKVEGGTI